MRLKVIVEHRKGLDLTDENCRDDEKHQGEVSSRWHRMIEDGTRSGNPTMHILSSRQSRSRFRVEISKICGRSFAKGSESHTIVRVHINHFLVSLLAVTDDWGLMTDVSSVIPSVSRIDGCDAISDQRDQIKNQVYLSSKLAPIS